MSLEISTISSSYLREIAQHVDDGDDKLSGNEYKLFAQEASKQGVEYDAIKCYLGMNAFEAWWYDVDKVSTDGKDDGKLSIGEIAESTVKGFFGNTIKSIVKHPVMSGITIAAGIGLIAATGGAAAPVLVALGATLGVGTIAANGVKVAKAENDADAKAAWEGIGTGLFATATSVLGAKSALNAGAKAGVKSAFGGKYMNPFEATVQCFKASPEALKVSGTNIVNNSKNMAIALGIVKKPTITPEQIEAHMANSAKYGFEIKPEQETYFNEQMAKIANDSWGGEHAVRDMRKVMAGLEKLNFEGNMTVNGYAEMAKSIDADLPGCYWSAAIKLYNQCAKNADIARTTSVVSEYISGVSSVNGMSGTFRLGTNGTQYLPLLGINTIANGKY